MKKLLAAVLLSLALPVAAGDGLAPKKKGLPEFLPVDQAFEIQPLEWRDGTLLVSWRITKDYYLYRDRLTFKAVEPAALKLGTPSLPASMPYTDEHFGTMQIYRDRLVVRLPVDRSAKTVKLAVGYQGCADAGLCYPPQTRTLEASR